MKNSKILSTILLFFFFLSFSVAQESGSTEVVTKKEKKEVDYSNITTIFQKIGEYDEIVLKTDLDTLLANKKYSTPQPAKIYLKAEGKEELKFKLKLEARGKFRKRICDMPPLKLDFPKKALREAGLFNGADKLKLVTHCQDSEISEQTLTKEYWTYRLYNELTEYSFKVHPIKITYVHSEKPEETIESMAFLIESNEELSIRLNGEIVEEFGKKREDCTKESYYNTLMFQYMVGNTDWGVHNLRNVKLIRMKGQELLTVVPYDFDYSAVVKAPYARLNADYGQKSLEERVIQGKFVNKDDLAETAARFLALKDSGFTCFRSCPVLKNPEKKRIDQYLNGFYRFIKSEKKREAAFLDD